MVTVIDEKSVFISKPTYGSTLIWVLIMMLVLGIMITAGLMISQSYFNRSINQHVKQQAYYTALSTTKAIAEWLNGTSEEQPTEFAEQLKYIDKINTANDKTVKFDSTPDVSLGSCITEVSIIEDGNIRISTTAEYIDQQSTVNAILKKTTKTIGSEGGIPGMDKPLVIDPPGNTNPIPSDQKGKDDSGLSNVHAVLNHGNLFSIANNLSVESNPNWNSQFYELHTNGGNPNENFFIKLINGNFPKRDNYGKMQDRNMTIYSKHENLKGKYDNLIIYTQEASANSASAPPRKNIQILPNMNHSNSVDVSYKNDIRFMYIYNTAYSSMRIQINDTGDAIKDEKAKLVLPMGVNLIEKSSIYTRRDTEIGCRYWDLDFILAQAINGSLFYYLMENVPNFTLEGDLYVADNKTELYSGNWSKNNIFNGNIVVKKTTTDYGMLNVNNNINIFGGKIYVEDGGYLKFDGQASNVSNDIYVYPGGTVDVVSGPLFNCNIYAYSGLGSNGQPATVKLSSYNRFTGKMLNLEDKGVVGGVYLEGSQKDDGPKLIRGSGNGNFENGCIHALPGSYVDPSINDKNFCDHVIRKADYGNINRDCTCMIKLPSGIGGGGGTQEVISWQILGYDEKNNN